MARYAAVVDDPHAAKAYAFIFEAPSAEAATTAAVRMAIVADPYGCGALPLQLSERLVLANGPSVSDHVQATANYAVVFPVATAEWAHTPLYSDDLTRAPVGWLDSDGMLFDSCGRPLAGPRLERPSECFPDGKAPLRYFADVPSRFWLVPGIGAIMIDPFRLRGV